MQAGRAPLEVIILVGFGGPRGHVLNASEPPVYEAYAIRYATLLGYPVASLVWFSTQTTSWTSRRPSKCQTGRFARTILVDTDGSIGFTSMKRYDVADYTRPGWRCAANRDQAGVEVREHYMHGEETESHSTCFESRSNRFQIPWVEYDNTSGADRKSAANDDGTLPDHYQVAFNMNYAIMFSEGGKCPGIRREREIRRRPRKRLSRTMSALEYEGRHVCNLIDDDLYLYENPDRTGRRLGESKLTQKSEQRAGSDEAPKAERIIPRLPGGLRAFPEARTRVGPRRSRAYRREYRPAGRSGKIANMDDVTSPAGSFF